MRGTLLFVFLVFATVVTLSVGQESEDSAGEESWWTRFKAKVKTMFSKWRDDLRSLWDEVRARAADIRSWTAEMYESFKLKLKDWLEARPDVSDDEKNEIENFINKLRVSTEKPRRDIDP